MSSLPTSHAVADALTHYRQLRGLTADELAHTVTKNGYTCSGNDITALEHGECAITVDVLMALAFGLNVSPLTLLLHIPIDQPYGETSIATGVPANMDYTELRDWLHDKTSVSQPDRLHWHEHQVAKLHGLHLHTFDQLQGAQVELQELEETGALDQLDSLRLQILHNRIREFDRDLDELSIATAHAERTYQELQAANLHRSPNPEIFSDPFE